ncbi:MAG: PspA/IM30 family protein, partial [Deltaproteobacteria bacterium]|nr:PspA/IM30 family protein [Deltaproteobacteria bacterium]
REMEDTLVEIKASCAGVMAERKKAERQLEEITGRSAYWEEKAGMAIQKGRDDLAREALHEKRRYTRRIEVLESEIADLNQLVDQYQNDIRQLEEKLKTARNKQRMLTQRHIHAKRKRQAQEDIRRMDSADVVHKFDDFENRIERMESEADLVNYGRRTTLEEELDKLNSDDEIEEELQALKKKPASDTNDHPHTME